MSPAALSCHYLKVVAKSSYHNGGETIMNNPFGNGLFMFISPIGVIGGWFIVVLPTLTIEVHEGCFGPLYLQF